jgi:molybdopterin/thiamine biosynthesis adenylyltransferase
MRYRLKVADRDFRELARLATEYLPKEAAVFGLVGVSRHGDTTDILVRRVIAVPIEAYDEQLTYHLEIAPQAINGLASLAEANGLGALLCHCHGDESTYSPSDDFGERRVFGTLRAFVPPEAPTVSLLFRADGFEGRVWLPGSDRSLRLDEVVVIGRSIERHLFGPSKTVAPLDATLSRQVLAFGEDGQRAISASRVGVVGTGGTGSAVAEQLVRLGVRDLVLIDPDGWDPSNVTRVYTTVPSEAGDDRKKVARVADGLRRIAPSARIQAIPSSVVLDTAAATLIDRDLIFLCTDDHWGRSVVNQLAYQYLIPTLNLGVRMDATDGEISGASGTVDVLRPDVPCLWCRQALRSERIAAESLPRSARSQLEREGYVEGLDTPAPSVISLNTVVAGLAVTQFLQLLTDFMGAPGEIERMRYDPLNGIVHRGRTMPPDDCLCRHVRGFGDLKTLPVKSDLSFLER